MPIDQSTPSRTVNPPWKEGDILYLKSWNDHKRIYRAENVLKKVPDHPAVLLYRPSADSDYAVVALMTTLNGCSLADHGFAQSTPERLRGYIPIRPTPANAANSLSVRMQPFPTDKNPANSYINVGEIHALPGKVLQRFGDRKGHNYSLRPKSLKKLKRFLKDDANFQKAKAVALAHDVAKSYVSNPMPINPSNETNPSSHNLLPSDPAHASIETNTPLPPIPGSFPSSPSPASRVLLYSQVAAPANHRADRPRYAAVPPTRAPTYATQDLLNTAHPTYPVRSAPGSYPAAGARSQVPHVAARAVPNYRIASSLEQGISERQHLLGTSGYQNSEEERGRRGSWWYSVLLSGAIGALLYFSRDWWWQIAWPSG